MTCRVTRKRMREPLVKCISLQAERLLQAAEHNNNEELLKNVFYFFTTVLSEHTGQLHVNTCTCIHVLKLHWKLLSKYF